MSIGISVKTSDLLSGGLCAAYSSFVDKKSNILTPALEQVAYRVGGRFAASKVTTTDGYSLVVGEADLYTAGVAAADHSIRKNDDMKESLYGGLRAAISSYAAEKLLAALSLADTQFIGV